MADVHRQSNLNFRLMSLEFMIRDILRSPREILKNEGVSPGMTVLDFGCGPGGFSIAAAGLVGPDGLVYAVDIHPLAFEAVRKKTEKHGIGNIRIVRGDAIAGIPDESADMALLCDVLHDVESPEAVLSGLHRVLKSSGLLLVRDHRLDKQALQSMISAGELFKPSGGRGRMSHFVKTESSGKGE
jgi:ubiquinone/menaquinone biosynthesis C-methylase UbiE